jgi:TonB family protein
MIFLLVALFLAGDIPTEAERAQMTADGVHAYVAPAIYASNSNVSGRISVDVLVGEDGSVKDVRSHQPDSMLNSLAQTAAREWDFAPSRPGWRTVTFVIEPRGVTMDQSRLDTRYQSPRTLYVKWMHSLSLRLGPETSCQVHHELMHLELLPVVYTGMPKAHDPLYRAWEGALVTEFPNGSDFIDGGDAVTPVKFGERYICASCRKAYKAWLAAHHLERPPR